MRYDRMHCVALRCDALRCVTYPECFVKLIGIDVGTGSWLSTTTAAATATAERVSSEKHGKRVRERGKGGRFGFELDYLLLLLDMELASTAYVCVGLV
jgi:hypothetical protein